MIGYLKGTMLPASFEASESTLIFMSGNIGYELYVSLPSLERLEMAKAETEVWIYTHVREDALQLFGFADRAEKRLFLALLKVNGVGPKMALKILSSTSTVHLIAMIDSADVKALSGLPKVGKKTAEQLVLSLRGKLGPSEQSSVGAPLKSKHQGVKADIASALLNLGFRAQEVDPLVHDLPDSTQLEDGVRKGLSILSGGH